MDCEEGEEEEESTNKTKDLGKPDWPEEILLRLPLSISIPWLSFQYFCLDLETSFQTLHKPEVINVTRIMSSPRVTFRSFV